MKQPFNLSQEKIDQLFRHCIFDLTPKAIGNKYMYYHTSDNAYPCSDITEDLFESDNLKFRIIIYRTFEDTVFGAYPCTSIALEVSDLDFEELQKVKLEIYNTYKEFYNDLLESAPCELSSIEAHPRVIKPNE